MGGERSSSPRSTLGVPAGSIRCTVLIETILAAFEMDAILYELRDYGCALNAGRWDYIFSTIKKLGAVLPDRVQVTMTVPFMRAYTELLVRTCHARDAHAIGGMAAFIPSRRDAAVNEVALGRVREDKLRESGDGFDGTWVAHPDLVPVATEVFDGVLGSRPNQVDRKRDDVEVEAARARRLRRSGRRDHARGAALERLGRGAVPRRVAARAGRGGDRQPDGGRRDGRDLPLAGVELGQGRAASAEADVLAELAAVDAADDAKALFAEVALADELVEFLTLSAYGRLDA